MKTVKVRAKKGPKPGSYFWLRRLVAIVMVILMVGALFFVYYIGDKQTQSKIAILPSKEPDQASGFASPNPEKSPSTQTQATQQSPIPSATATRKHPVLYIVIDDYCGLIH